METPILIQIADGIGKLFGVISREEFYKMILVMASYIAGLSIGDMIASYIYGPLRKFKERMVYLALFLFIMALSHFIPSLIFGIRIQDTFTNCVLGFGEAILVVFICRTLLKPLFRERGEIAGLSPHEYFALNLLLQGKSDKEIIGTLVSKGLTPEKSFKCLERVKDKIIHASEKFKLMGEKIGEMDRELFELNTKVSLIEKKLNRVIEFQQDMNSNLRIQ